jgi:hypothetical protein
LLWSNLRQAAVNEHFASSHETGKEERHGGRLLRAGHAGEGRLVSPAISAPPCPVFARHSSRSGVVVAPGDNTFTRIPVAFKSSGQFPTKLRIAAVVAL